MNNNPNINDLNAAHNYLNAAHNYLDDMINGHIDNEGIVFMENFINQAYNPVNNAIINDVGIINHTNNLVVQLQNPIGGQDIRRQLLLELEWLIGTRDNLHVPVIWLNDIVPRLRQVVVNNGARAFINNYLNQVQGYSAAELNYVYRRVLQMNPVA